MFERFTEDARRIVVAAREEARGLRADTIDPVHLLLALTGDAGPGGGALRAAGLDHDRVRSALVAVGHPLDADALAAVGVDLAQVTAAAEAAFGPGALDRGRKAPGGHISFAEGSKRALELAARLVGRRRTHAIDTGSLLFGVLAADDPLVGRVLRHLGTAPEALEGRVGGDGEVA